MKKQSLKSRIIALALMSSVASTSMPTPQAHAALGLLAMPLGIGFVFLAAGAGTTYAGMQVAKSFREAQKEGRQVKAFFLQAAAIFTMASGMIMLDGEDVSNARMEFGSLSDEKAREMGLSSEEHSAFERERAEINALREETIVRGLKAAEKNPDMSTEQLVESVSRDWKELSTGVLSKESLSAVQKISAAGLSKL